MVVSSKLSYDRARGFLQKNIVRIYVSEPVFVFMEKNLMDLYFTRTKIKDHVDEQMQEMQRIML